MVRKEFTYRGFKIEDLQKMSIEEFAKLVDSRRRRTLKRGFSPRQKKLIVRLRKNPGKPLRTHCRNMVILPEFINRTFSIFNGKEYVNVKIEPGMIGHYLGEFALTRRRVIHSAPGMGATRGSKYVALK